MSTDKPIDPAKLERKHKAFAKFLLVTMLVAFWFATQTDGWGWAFGIIIGFCVISAVDQIIKASTYASAQTSVDVLLEVAKRGQR